MNREKKEITKNQNASLSFSLRVTEKNYRLSLSIKKSWALSLAMWFLKLAPLMGLGWIF